MNGTQIPAKQLPPQLRSLTKKRHANVRVVKTPVKTFGTWWDGGSRSEYSYLNLQTGQRRPSYAPTNPMSGEASVELVPLPGWVVIETGVFCGKPATLTVYALPEDLPFVLGLDCPDMPASVAADWYADQGRTDEETLLRKLIA